MRNITISHKVKGIDVICRHCGNAESAKDSFLKHFRLEGTGKNSTSVRCLYCQTAIEVPMSELGSLYYHYAC